jgi:hypothetical protein
MAHYLTLHVKLIELFSIACAAAVRWPHIKKLFLKKNKKRNNKAGKSQAPNISR